MTTAELLLTRIMAGVIAVGAALFFLLSLGDILDESTLAPIWWSLAAALAVFGAPVAVAALLPFLGLGATRIALGIVAAAYLGAAASATVVLEPSDIDGAPWVVNNTAAAAAAAALALPRVAAWAYNAAVSALVVAVQLTVAGAREAWPATQDALYSFAFCAVFIALAQYTTTIARRLDRQRSAESRAAQATAAERSRGAAQVRVDALLHDTVLASLMLASRGGERVEPAVRDQARAALVALEAERRGASPDPAAVLTGEALRDFLARRLRTVHPGIVIAGDAPVASVPADTAEVVARAAAEAARNSVRHAGLRGAPPEIAFLGADGFALRISDDGAGFEPARVPAGRLGIRRSIVDRVEALPGGSVVVDSAPGAGTRITLAWSAP